MEDSLTAEKGIIQALKMTAGDIGTNASADGKEATQGEPGAEVRTLAHPDWDGAVTPNFDRVATLPPTPLDQFEADTQRL